MLAHLARLSVPMGTLVFLVLLAGCPDLAPENEQEAPSPTPASSEEGEALPREEQESLEEELNTTDLAVEIERSADQLHTGEVVTYKVTVVNNGPNPATDVYAVNTLPDELGYIEDDAGCDQQSSREIGCDLGEIPARESVTVQLEVRVELDASASGTVRYEVAVENRAGPDPDPENNRAVDEAEYGEQS